MLKQSTIFPKLIDIRNEVIDFALIYCSAIAIIGTSLSLIRIFYVGFSFAFFLQILGLALILTTTPFRRKLSVSFKITVVILSLLLFLIPGLYKYGFLSSGKMLLLLIPTVTVFAFPLRKVIGFFVLTMAIYFVFGYLWISGKLSYGYDTLEYTTKLNTWLMDGVHIIGVSLVMMIIITKFSNSIIRQIHLLENKNIEISDNERYFREIYDSSTDAIFIQEPNGKIIDVNRAMLEMYGYEKEEIKFIEFNDLCSGVSPYTALEAGPILQNAFSNESQLFEWFARKKSGEFFWVEVGLKKISVGNSVQILAVVRDIDKRKQTSIELEEYRHNLEKIVFERTEELVQTNDKLMLTNKSLAEQKISLESALSNLNKAQAKLIESEKMASLGVLMAGISHEINNPLNFINGGIVGLESYFDKNLKEHIENVSPLVNAINVGVKRTTDIVKSLSHYSRRDDNLPRSECYINSIVDNCLIMLHNQLKNKAVVQKYYTELPYKLIGNEGKLHQAILNILSNAVQSIEKNGLIFITTKLESNLLSLAIIDNGCGISDKNLDKVFDPFFTTKDPGKGTGLGLSITHKIIQDHKGHIEFKSEIGKGTTVCIKLPIEDNNL